MTVNTQIVTACHRSIYIDRMRYGFKMIGVTALAVPAKMVNL
jgi:hypothetical protein